MMNHFEPKMKPRLNVLHPEDVEEVYSATMEVLERTGIKVTHPAALRFGSATMPQLFPRKANALPVLSLLGVLGGGLAVTLLVWYYFSPQYTDVGYMPCRGNEL